MYYYENEYGDCLSLDYGTDEYMLRSIDGVDHLTNEIVKVRGMGQDGSTVVASTIQDRPITITGFYLANNFSQENLTKVFNPTAKGILTYKRAGYPARRLFCKVEQSPMFTKGTCLHEFKVELLCEDPYWQEVEPTKVEFSSVTPKFYFPVGFKTNFELSTVDKSKAKDILNDGDVQAPLLIEFIAKGNVTNPSIETENGFIKFRGLTLNKDDRVVVNTEYGKKEIEVIRSNGTVEKGFKYLTYNSKFLQLAKGTTRFTFNAETNVDNLYISFKFIKRFIGVI